MKQERIDKYIQTFDELNVLSQNTDESERVDVAETLLVMAYRQGKEDAGADLGYSKEEDDELDYFFDTGRLNEVTGEPQPLSSSEVEEMQRMIYEKVDGKTFADRISDGLTTDEFSKVVETEFHRVYNGSALNEAERIERATGRTLGKTWVTVKDNKVRATHEPLEGVTKALNEKFYTIDGDEALYPGGFSNPSNVINCRCRLDFKYIG